MIAPLSWQNYQGGCGEYVFEGWGWRRWCRQSSPRALKECGLNNDSSCRRHGSLRHAEGETALRQCHTPRSSRCSRVDISVRCKIRPPRHDTLETQSWIVGSWRGAWNVPLWA